MASFGVGVGLVAFSRASTPVEAPAGVSTWALNLPRTVTTCQLASVPCVSIRGRGARFTLETSNEVVRLAVQVGAVQVTSSDGQVREVLASESFEFHNDAVRQARALEARGDVAGAEASLARAAAGTSLSAEAALYEQGVLHLRRGNDLEGALQLFTQFQARFPNGALAPEVALSRLETLSRLGRDAEAASAASQFLREFPDSERAGEVRRFQSAPAK